LVTFTSLLTSGRAEKPAQVNDEEGGGGSTAASLVGAARVFCFFLAASPVFVISYKNNIKK